MKTLSKAKKKQQKKKIIVTSIVVGAAGILGYFGWQYLKKKKTRSGTAPTSDNLDDLLKNIPPSTSITTPNTPSSGSTVRPIKRNTNDKPKSQNSSSFPLKQGSKGELVHRLQEALIAKYGKTILPKYGADGDFGSETVAALKKIGFPWPITESAFNVLVQNTNASTSSSNSYGQQLFEAANAKDFNKVITVLKQMTSTTDYNNANEVFKTQRIGGGVRQTIVTGLLNTFTKADQKEKLKLEFLRMGLEFDGKQWTISGLDGFPIMTVVPTTVWIDGINAVKVPARMVLGKAINRKLDYTLFHNRGKYFLVQTKCVKHL